MRDAEGSEQHEYKDDRQIDSSDEHAIVRVSLQGSGPEAVSRMNPHAGNFLRLANDI